MPTATHAEEGFLAPRADVEALLLADHGDPFAVLGPHRLPDGAVAVRVLLPHAREVAVIAPDGGSPVTLRRTHPQGFFEGTVGAPDGALRYRLRVWPHDAESIDIDDPYRFPPVLGDLDIHLLGEGRHFRNYARLGAHPMEMEGVAGTAFAVWAPNARSVAVVGDFNGWDGRVHPMRRRHGVGVWEIFLPGVRRGARYKFQIKSRTGELLPLKADPCAFMAETPPRTASVVRGLPDHGHWRDGSWMETRAAAQARSAPISIYEVHLGSWRRVPERDNGYLTYNELAETLVPYVKDMGFTHVELMPISEYPFDGSWGYQPIGLFAPTSRFGTPGEFAALVDRFHREGIGVLLDWVPGHFPTDPHGLGRFDGTALYEHADPRQGFHPDWNTLVYNYGRREVSNFLLGNALYWCEQFHIDGLRVDAVASMLYLDYSRKEGEWVPNRFGGRENLEAIDFLKQMNTEVFGRFPGVTTVAEESTAWPGVSRPVHLGGLGFGYKWNMGWMHDTLRYMAREPVHRRWHHNDMTFGLIYAFSENFVLPLSHDEVTHGKGSLIAKMPGDEWQKFANLRAYFGFMFSHPGKKLLFMGGEFGQRREWNHDTSLDWHLLAHPRHAGLQTLVRDLNRVYRAHPALHELDCEPHGFEWIEGNDSDNSVFAYLRRGREPERPVVAVCNFTPIVRDGYRVGVPHPGHYREILNTDAEIYGGSNTGNAGGVTAEAVPWHGRPWSLRLTLPPLAALLFERVPA
ncbi:MAG: 1,4-alpha-glucan branching protein GlgB [Rhodospirillaceae bacterium]|nr:1,4-alpha-glucan branching protein GlgB [Rhodospirillaceae bacterium]